MDAAWVGLIGVAVGSGITLGYNFWHDWSGGREKYRVMLYERRLEVHQKGFYLVHKLSETMPDSIKGMKRVKAATISELSHQLEEWWTLNLFYLDEESRRRIIEAIVWAEDLVTDYTIQDDSNDRLDDNKLASWRNDHREFSKCIQETLISLEKGIGMKHIDKLKKKKHEDSV